jgi:hypothetical protein
LTIIDQKTNQRIKEIRIQSRDIVLLKVVKGDRTGGLPVVYAVGLHDIEESLLAHTVLFLKKREERELFLMCSSEMGNYLSLSYRALSQSIF